MQGQKAILPIKKFEAKLMAYEFSYVEKDLAIFENKDPNVER